MRSLGFKTYLPDEIQAPIIVTFHTPSHKNFSFDLFYESLKSCGFVIYPGKLTEIKTFRIGCIGQVKEKDMVAAVDSVEKALAEMGVIL